MNLPQWIRIQAPNLKHREFLKELDSGEQAAISLALDVQADVVLLDEQKARQVVTERLHLRVTGTLGTIREAHQAGLVNGYEVFERLCSTTNFRISTSFRNTFPDLLKQSDPR